MLTAKKRLGVKNFNILKNETYVLVRDMEKFYSSKRVYFVTVTKYFILCTIQFGASSVCEFAFVVNMSRNAPQPPSTARTKTTTMAPTVYVRAPDGGEGRDAPFADGARGLGGGRAVAVLAEELVELNAAGGDAVDLAPVGLGAAARRHPSLGLSARSREKSSAARGGNKRHVFTLAFLPR